MRLDKITIRLISQSDKITSTPVQRWTLWEHSSCWACIESISAVDNHPYYFLAHPMLPAVSDIHATFATLVRCYRCSPYFCNLRISAHYVAPCANPSQILPIMSICFTGALISISFHISYCICTDGLASWPITSQSPLIPKFLSPPASWLRIMFPSAPINYISLPRRSHSPCDV